MTATRPLREVFDELAGDPTAAAELGTGPAGVLAASGHGDLPEALVSEAIVSYADTAPTEIAEHLAPFVRAHSPVPPDGPAVEPAESGAAEGLALLTTAPAGPELDGDTAEPAALDGAATPVALDDAAAPVALDGGEEPGYGSGELAGAGRDPFDLAFGEGGAQEPVGEPLPAGEPAERAGFDQATDVPALAGTEPDVPEPGREEPDLFGMPAPEAEEAPDGEAGDGEVDQWGGGAAG